MAVDTEIDWEAIKQEIMRFFGIPDQLERNGISAIRAMVYRRRGEETVMVLDIAHGEVGLIGEHLDDVVQTAFASVRRERVIELGSNDHPGKGYITVDIRGDLIVLEYLCIEGLEKEAEKLAGGMLMLVGNYANRNQ